MREKLLAVPALALCFVGAGVVGANASATSLQELVNDAEVGGTVIADEDYTGTLTITKNLTIDLGEYAVKGSIRVNSGAVVTLKGGVVTGYSYALGASGEGTSVTIESGTYTGEECGNRTTIHASDKATITINGGDFHGSPLVADKCAVTIKEGKVFYAGSNSEADGNQEKHGKIIITGGTFAGRISTSNWGVYEISGGTFDRDEVVIYDNPESGPSTDTGETGSFAEAGWLAEGYEMVALDGGGYVVKIEKFTVKFNLNDIEADGIADINDVEYGENIEKPTDPSVTGYDFDGWYLDADCTEEFDFATDEIKTDTTLYAKWTLKDGYTKVKATEDTWGAIYTKDLADLIDEVATIINTESEQTDKTYTTKSIDELKQAKVNAETTLQNATLNHIGTQANIDAQKNLLQSTKDALVDISKLRAAIEDAQGRINHADKYTDDSIIALEEALEKSRDLYSDELVGQKAQNKVNAATKALKTAYDNAEKRASVESLEDLYNRIMTHVDAEEIVVEQDSALEAALENAQDLLDKASNIADTKGNRKTIADATNALRSAYMRLKINNEAIDVAISVINELADGLDSADYTTASWNDLVDAVNDLLDFVDEYDGDKSEEDIKSTIEEYLDAIEEAADALVLAGDYTELDKAIEKADGIETAGYTEESVKNFKEALEAAKTTRANDLSNSEEDQAAIDEATEALNNAIAALIKAPDTGALTNTADSAATANATIIATIATFIVLAGVTAKAIIKR